MVNLVLNWASGVLLIQANQLSDRANETDGVRAAERCSAGVHTKWSLIGAAGRGSLETARWIT